MPDHPRELHEVIADAFGVPPEQVDPYREWQRQQWELQERREMAGDRGGD